MGPYTTRVGRLSYIPGGTPYNGVYGEAPPERVTFFRSLDTCIRKGSDFTSLSTAVSISLRVGKSVIWILKGPNRANR